MKTNSPLPKLPELKIQGTGRVTVGVGDKWVMRNDYGELFATRNFSDAVPIWRKYKRLGWALRYVNGV